MPIISGPKGGGVGVVAAGDASITVGGTLAAPTIETADLSTIAGLHANAGDVAMNAKKITGLANGTAATDGAALGQVSVQLLCSQVLTGTQATFDTNTLLGGNIPATFNHLRMMIMGRDDSVSNSISACFVQFNADTGANYDTQYIYGSATTATVAQTLAATSATMGLVTQGGGTAGLFSENDFLIQNYARAVANKAAVGTSFSLGGAGTASSDFRMWTMACKWRSSAAITRIVATAQSGNWNIGSAFYLYGLT